MIYVTPRLLTLDACADESCVEGDGGDSKDGCVTGPGYDCANGGSPVSGTCVTGATA